MYLVNDIVAVVESNRHNTKLRRKRVHPRGIAYFGVDMYYYMLGKQTSLLYRKGRFYVENFWLKAVLGTCSWNSLRLELCQPYQTGSYPAPYQWDFWPPRS